MMRYECTNDRLADHYGLQSIIRVEKQPREAPPVKVKSRNFYKGSYSGIKRALKEIGINKLCFPPNMDVDNAWDDLYGFLWPMVDTFFPEIEHLASAGAPKYLKLDTRAALKEKKRASRRGTNAQFKAAQKRAQKHVDRDKKDSVAATMARAANKQKASWQLADRAMGRNVRSDLSLLDNKKTSRDCADTVNAHYIEKTERLRTDAATKATKLKFGTNDLLESNVYPVPPEHGLTLSKVSISCVKRHVRRLRNTRAVGVDGIPTIIWKNCIDELAAPLTSLINLSLEQCKFPTAFKTSIVVPVFKAKEEADSYRLVSLLPVVSKILESVVADQIKFYLEDNNLLPSTQHGFRAGHSTSTAVAAGLASWTRLKPGAVITSFDLTAAFDTVQTKLLLDIMGKLNMDDKVISWTRSYLTGCKQKVRWNDAVSEELDLEGCCKQGTLLATLFFNIVGIPLAQVLKARVTYADDNSGADKTKEGAQEQVVNFERTAAASGLSLNARKTQIMVI